MLKWQGDFTLPRFRAKLANKYLLHPDVEPGYEEVYRADLGETTIERKGFGNSLGGSSGGFYRTLGGGESLTSSRAQSSTTLRMGGSFGRSASFTDLRSIGNTTLRPDPFASTRSLPKLTQSSSVPTIGLKRHEVAPTCRMNTSLSQSSFGPMSVPSSPTGGDADRREMEKAAAMESASRRLWSASHGAELYIKETLEMMKTGVGGPLKSIVVPGMKRALSQGAKYDWKNDEWDGATLLMKAVRTNALELTMYLLAVGADPMIEDYSGRNILHWAAMEGNPAMMEYILNNVKDIKPITDDGGGDTPLHLAAYHGHMPVVRLLIRAQADPSMPNAGGFNAIQLAEARRMWHIAHYLSEQKQQQDDLAAAGDETELRILRRPCDILRADELKEEEKIVGKPKAKAKAKAKAGAGKGGAEAEVIGVDVYKYDRG